MFCGHSLKLLPLFLVSGWLLGQAPFADPSLVTVRIDLGVGDSAPATLSQSPGTRWFPPTDTSAAGVWNGQVTVAGGEIENLASLRPRPSDLIAADSWELESWQGPSFGHPPEKPQPVTGTPVNVFNPGLLLQVRSRGGARLDFQTKQGDFAVDLERLASEPPMTLLEGRVSVEAAVTSERITDQRHEDDFAAVATGPGQQAWVAWVGYSDSANQVFLRHYDGNRWEERQAVTEGPGDVFVAKVARDGSGRVWVVWSDQIDGNRDLYARSLSTASGTWSPVVRLTSDPQPDLYHALATDSLGRVWLAWQGFRDGRSHIFARYCDDGSWSEPELVSDSGANDWEPAIAADSSGMVYVAWDTYDKGSYDILIRRRSGGSWDPIVPIADTPKFEAHVSLAVDGDDRPWAAWSESGTQWGKDDGFGLESEGTRLYAWRSIAVAVRDGDRWLEPEVPLDDALPHTLAEDRNDSPVIQVDGHGGVWLFFRHRTPRVRDVISDHWSFYATWELWGLPYSEGGWGSPVYFPNSAGRLDVRSGFAVASDGSIVAAWPTDGRDYDHMIAERNDIFVGRLPPARPGNGLRLRPRVQPEITVHPIHPDEGRDLEAIRNYRIRSGGRTYAIYRGDTHRHTEFSMDGINDGSLLQAYRYAIDAAALDFYANSEHNYLGGPDDEYVDFLLQQMADNFHLPGSFVPLFAYERSVTFPNGHRNILFAKRGVRPFPISREEFGGSFPFSSDSVTDRYANPEPVGTKELYAYLKENGGISIPHTSSSRRMGTDWRDNDPEVEPLVEIYQGDRYSAEYEGAPRGAISSNPASAPGGFQAAGLVWNAWAKGYKLGVQAASDHVSTHISFACTISEDGSREGLLDAMRMRHSYGATDNIVLDYRMRSGDREFLQGDIATVTGPFRLWVRVIGTEPIRQIDIIRNQEFIHNRQRLGRDVSFEFTDRKPKDGENYYYVRVQQADGQLAWSSPIWITRRDGG
ncbi:MAG: hypothetical protein OXN97_24785 [Bryobacterales bacterium]|nr:hypothetical protein [Bryobacterales bacterium]